LAVYLISGEFMGDSPVTRPSLLVRIRDSRDAQAWCQFVDIYAPLIHGYARKHGLQDADAADLTEDVLGIVARSIPKLEYDPKRGSFRGWLFTIVRKNQRKANFAHRTAGSLQREYISSRATANLKICAARKFRAIKWTALSQIKQNHGFSVGVSVPGLSERMAAASAPCVA
jgi:hypothetical protein